VVGVQLAGRNATPGPVATQPDAPSVVGPQCGDAAPEVPAVTADTPAGPYLEGSAGPEVVAGDPVPTTLRLVNDGAGAVSLDAATPTTFAVVADGLVVATTGLYGAAGVIEPGGFLETSGAIDLVACGGDTPLDPGDYQMFAAVTLTLADGPRDLVAGPWPFTITDPFPACGSTVPSGDDPVLALDLALGERVYTPGDLVKTVATVRTTNGRTVIGNAPVAGALIVLTRDGVVIGRGDPGTGDVDILDLAADQTAQVAATGQLSLCGIPQTDAAQDGLPAGTYQAYAVMEVMLQEVTEAGGEATSVTELIAARSNPVDITVGVP